MEPGKGQKGQDDSDSQSESGKWEKRQGQQGTDHNIVKGSEIDPSPGKEEQGGQADGRRPEGNFQQTQQQGERANMGEMGQSQRNPHRQHEEGDDNIGKMIQRGCWEGMDR